MVDSRGRKLAEAEGSSCICRIQGRSKRLFAKVAFIATKLFLLMNQKVKLHTAVSERSSWIDNA